MVSGTLSPNERGVDDGIERVDVQVNRRGIVLVDADKFALFGYGFCHVFSEFTILSRGNGHIWRKFGRPAQPHGDTPLHIGAHQEGTRSNRLKVVGEHGGTEGITLEEHDSSDLALLNQTVHELICFVVTAAVMGLNLCNKHLADLFRERHLLQALLNTGVSTAENLPCTPLLRARFCCC